MSGTETPRTGAHDPVAERGCTCLGIDVSPASISYAERIAGERALACSYRLGDVRTVDLGSDHDLAMMVFGELNTFSRADAADLLRRVGQSLRPGGALVLEVHIYDFVVAEGTSPAGWYTSSHGGSIGPIALITPCTNRRGTRRLR